MGRKTPHANALRVWGMAQAVVYRALGWQPPALARKLLRASIDLAFEG
jgi:hypothetical protein